MNDTSTAAMISLDTVCLSMPSRAGQVDILNDMSLDIAPGETVAMLGPSGAGKTTAMMVMAGLENVTSGKVVVAGHDLAARDEDALARIRRDHIGIIFQAFRLIPSMTALENTAIPLELDGDAEALPRLKRRWSMSGLATGLTIFPISFPGASNSVWRLPGPLSPARRSCLLMSRQGISIRPPAPRSWSC